MPQQSIKIKDNDKIEDSGELQSFIGQSDFNAQVGFPVFIKILIIFIVLGLLPLILISLIALNKYDAILESFAKVLAGGDEGGIKEILLNIDQAKHNLRVQTGFLIILFSMLSFVGIIFSTRILVKPLLKLIIGVRKLINGEYGTEIKIKSTDEFSVFANYFNQMSNKFKTVLDREQAISKMKSEFISLAAHQLRTPLSATKWTMKMLIEGDIGNLKSEQKKFLEKGYETNERMIRLINDLLDVARIEEGKFGYNFEYGDITAIIEKAINDQSLTAQTRNIKIVFNKPARTFPKIKVDSQKIKLAIENLLENSINYTLSGGLIEITIAQYGSEYIEVKIKDTGVGIPENQKSRIFSKFFRAENVIKMQTDGSGLGLFIVKNIIKRHGGEIWIESEEGKGTTVHFTLPFSERLIPEKEEVFGEFIKGF